MKETLFSRRAFILGAGQSLLLATVVGRLYYLQIFSGEHYRMLSDKNRIQNRLIPPLRGEIFDCQGKVLATSRKNFQVLWLSTARKGPKETLERLEEMLNLSPTEKRRLLKEIASKPKWLPVVIKTSLSWKEVAALELARASLPGILIEEGHSRFYPESFLTCHLVGYVGAALEEEAKENPLLALPQMRVGKTGLEKALETTLRGNGGIEQFEVNAKRQIIRDLNFLPGKAGKDIRLTLNIDLQKKAYELLAPYESGAIVMLNSQTGAVLSLISCPGFDSNLFVEGISADKWSALLSNPRQALVFKAITGQYAPGSCFKMVVALAALKAEAVRPDKRFTCHGFVELGSHRFHCHSWSYGGHGAVNLSDALKLSCDVYFYQVAALIGIDLIAAMAKNCGLGAVTGIEIPGEKPGLIPTRSWKERIFGRSWQMGETYNVSIGQGYALATPLQLAVMIAALSNGGKRVKPYLYQSTQEEPVLDIPAEHLSLIQEGLFRAVNEVGGTSFKGRITKMGLQMAGKTATSQVVRISERERKLNTLNRSTRLWEHKEHAIFVGYAPVNQPRFAIAVLLEHAGAGKHAVPLARDLLWLAQQTENKT